MRTIQKVHCGFIDVVNVLKTQGVIGRPGISAIRAVPSTAHGMLKFPVDGGIVTIYNTAAPPKECNTVTCDVTQTQRQHATKVTNLKVAIHPDYPEQEVSIGGSLSDTGRAAVCALLQRNLDIFAWEPKHMTGVPRSITEHKLKIRQGYSPVRQKKRGQALERAKGHSEERPRTAVKGQILADFLIEKLETNAVLPQSEVKLQEPWILFTDRSSCVDGSGAGLILTNTEGRNALRNAL
ncbi:hypothetical protein Tco_1253948 [Tanacetum coccineum]